MKTVTFDPAVYKLVPVISTTDMDRAADKAIENDDCSAEQVFTAMLSEVPDQLPGVTVHSGEPVAEIISTYGDPESFGERGLVSLCDIQKYPYNTKLYAHPAPSQPSVLVEDGLVSVPREILGATCYLLNKYKPESETLKKLRAITFGQAQPSAEAIVQAALEAAAKDIAILAPAGSLAQHRANFAIAGCTTAALQPSTQEVSK